MKKHYYLWIAVSVFIVVMVWFIGRTIRHQPSLMPNTSVATHAAQLPAGAQRVSNSQISSQLQPLSHATSRGTNAANRDRAEELRADMHSTNVSKATPNDTEIRLMQEATAGVSLNPELARASAEFQQNSGFGLRPKPARKLLPYLKKGMSKSEVKSLLGEPSRVSDDELFWSYTIFYSQSIDMYFNRHSRVERIDACVSTNVTTKTVGASNN
jgi:hypothetical protein